MPVPHSVSKVSLMFRPKSRTLVRFHKDCLNSKCRDSRAILILNFSLFNTTVKFGIMLVFDTTFCLFISFDSVLLFSFGSISRLLTLILCQFAHFF